MESTGTCTFLKRHAGQRAPDASGTMDMRLHKLKRLDLHLWQLACTGSLLTLTETRLDRRRRDNHLQRGSLDLHTG
jgi:hypothetical protein